MTGHVTLVGAGPGDPGLLTLAGAEALRSADVVFIDALAPRALLRYAPPEAEVIDTGKRAGAHRATQDEINALLVEAAQAGKRVVRLKGGDPFVFGRGGEEAQACRAAGVPFSVVPGVSAGIAAPAYAGIPPTQRGMASSILFLTGQEMEGPREQWRAVAAADTVLLFMATRELARAMEAMVEAGKPADTPAAAIRWGTRADQRTVRSTVAGLAQAIDDAGLKAPVLSVIGPTVDLADEIGWFDPGPLAGLRVAVTGSRRTVASFGDGLARAGALVAPAPVLGVEPMLPAAELLAQLAGDEEWVALTSPGAAEIVVDALRSEGRDARFFGGRKVAVLGSGTKEAMREAGIIADISGTEPSAAGLAEALVAAGARSVVHPASVAAGPALGKRLTAAGATLRTIDAYRPIDVPLAPVLLDDVLDAEAILFASGSSVAALSASLPESWQPDGVLLVALGARTAPAVEARFGRVDAVAPSPSPEGVTQALLELRR